MNDWMNERSPRSWKDLRKRLEANGYKVVEGGRRHWRVVRADGSYALAWPTSPGDQNGIKAWWTTFRQIERRGPGVR